MFRQAYDEQRLNFGQNGRTKQVHLKTPSQNLSHLESTSGDRNAYLVCCRIFGDVTKSSLEALSTIYYYTTFIVFFQKQLSSGSADGLKDELLTISFLS